MHRKIRQSKQRSCSQSCRASLVPSPLVTKRSSILWAQELGFCENTVWSSVAFSADSASIRKKGSVVSQQQNISTSNIQQGDSQFTTVRTLLIQGCQKYCAIHAAPLSPPEQLVWDKYRQPGMETQNGSAPGETQEPVMIWRPELKSWYCSGPSSICVVGYTIRANPLLLQFLDTIVCTPKIHSFLPFQLSQI